MKNEVHSTEDHIRLEAYLLSENAGHPRGMDAVFWAQAEALVKTRLDDKATAKKPAARKTPAKGRAAAKAAAPKQEAATPATAPETPGAKKPVATRVPAAKKTSPTTPKAASKRKAAAAKGSSAA